MNIKSNNLKKLTITLTLLLTILITGCQQESNVNNISISPEPDIKELVHYYSRENVNEETASISSEYLFIENNEGGIKYILPEDEFFVSIAPYIINTHPWENHSLTGCQGELIDKEFDVVITKDSGEEILNETLNSGHNGFIDLWLPRNEKYEISIKYDGKFAKSELTTYKDSNTCITTIRLEE